MIAVMPKGKRSSGACPHGKSPPGARREGFILIWVIVIMSFGFLVVAGLLTYANVSLLATKAAITGADEYYAADAGVAAVTGDILQGTDVLGTGYSPPTVNLNGKAVSLSVTGASGLSLPAPGYSFFNPGAASGLSSLAAASHYTFQMANVVAASAIQVNWPFAPASKSWALTLYSGAGTGGTIVASSSGRSSPGLLTVSSGLISGGTYTLDFYNTSGENQFLDPTTGLDSLAAGATYFYPVASVAALTPLQVNWAFSPPGSSWQIAVHQGSGTGPVVASNSGSAGPGTLTVSGSQIAGGTYTVGFTNTSATPLATGSFSSGGGSGFTWVYANIASATAIAAAPYSGQGSLSTTWVYCVSSMDCVVVATAGSTAIHSVVRQQPGPTVPGSIPSITILSWQSAAAGQ